MSVTAEEKLLLACYRIEEAMRHLDERYPLTLFDRLCGRRHGSLGVGWASADLALSKAKAALGLDLGHDDELLNRKPEVKEIERRLYAERRKKEDET